MVAQRYELLQKLHDLLQPRGYMEIGVQNGGSLELAKCEAIGIDPAPFVTVPLGANTTVTVATSDGYFVQQTYMPKHIDLAFIDGMHLAEYALRDFMNVERVANAKTVIAFDDVLPYNAAIAGRVQPPGDWTGDVWKIVGVLKQHRQDLRMLLVDTHPTGTLVVFNVDPTNSTLSDAYSRIEPRLMLNEDPPDEIIFRRDAISQDDAIETLREWL